jgi:hypothetical protein
MSFIGVLNDKCGDFSGKKINEIKDSVYNIWKIKNAFRFYETTGKLNAVQRENNSCSLKTNGSLIIGVKNGKITQGN